MVRLAIGHASHPEAQRAGASSSMNEVACKKWTRRFFSRDPSSAKSGNERLCPYGLYDVPTSNVRPVRRTYAKCTSGTNVPPSIGTTVRLYHVQILRAPILIGCCLHKVDMSIPALAISCTGHRGKPPVHISSQESLTMARGSHHESASPTQLHKVDMSARRAELEWSTRRAI